ncbi:MAG TPA: fumarylacetoacetase [Burkholderiaceae bacterium]|nr:fumarylacetoacetase [Burkholderiaceae bacterium]
MLNETHAPNLRSWIESANLPGIDFPIQNLPHGVFRRRSTSEALRGGVAIGDMILDLRAALRAGAFSGTAAAAAEMAAAPTLNGLMAMGPIAWSTLRLAISKLLREGAPPTAALRDCMVPQADAEYALAAQIGDYTDFFTSYHHMVNAGRVFQPDNPPLPNFKWLPIGYHGRSSSIDISGTQIRRPLGQSRAPGEGTPHFGPTRRLDYEMELGAFIGAGNARGESIDVNVADQHVFGLCLLNDWSARDVQGWESQPLGPFLAKNFATSLSPWIVTLEALEPFRIALPREATDPQPLPNLRHRSDTPPQGFDIELEVWLATPRSDGQAMRLSRSNFRHCYWSLAQMVTHHTEGGCNLRPGDLLGTGTQSGPGEGEQGCLLELSRGGKQPIALPNGESRSFLEDGDVVTLRAWCEREGCARIGFGACSGEILAAAST